MNSSLKLILPFFLLLLQCNTPSGISNPQGWPITLGGQDSFCAPNAVATDTSGNVYIAGLASGSVDLDSGEGISMCISDYEDIHSFVVKYDNPGAFQWAKCFGQGFDDFHLCGVCVNGNWDVYAAGTGWYNVTEGSLILSFLADEDEYPVVKTTIHIYKMDTLGNILWETILGANINDEGEYKCNDIITDSSGNVYIAGSFSDEMHLNLEDGEYIASSVGYKDSFVCKIRPDGQIEWIRTWGGDYKDDALSLSSDSNSNIYITGIFTPSYGIVFDTGQSVSPSTVVTTLDCFLLKLSNDGEIGWVSVLGGSEPEDTVIGRHVVTTGSDNIIVMGEFDGTLGTTLGDVIKVWSSNGRKDIFMIEFDSEGVLNWSQTFGGSGIEQAQGAFIDSSGGLYFSGNFQDDVDFDPGLDEEIVTGDGEYNSFLSKYNSKGQFESVYTKPCRGGLTGTYSNNTLYLSGYFSGEIDLGFENEHVMRQSIGVTDGFVVRLDMNEAELANYEDSD